MNDRQVAFRLPGDLVDKIDEKANALRQQTPGMRVTRADVVRAILVRGLDESEEAALASSAPASVHWSPVTTRRWFMSRCLPGTQKNPILIRLLVKAHL